MRRFLTTFGVSTAIFMIVIVFVQFCLNVPENLHRIYFLDNMIGSLKFGAIMTAFYGIDYEKLWNKLKNIF